MASSFNTDIAEQVGSITAMETRATGIPWNFNPVLDIGRQHLWPRYYILFLSLIYANLFVCFFLDCMKHMVKTFIWLQY
jgi:hypothetical protein